MIGSKGIASVYLNDTLKGEEIGGKSTWEWFRQIRMAAEKRASGKPLKILFTQLSSPVKGQGTGEKTLFLCNDMFRGSSPFGGEDIRRNVKFVFAKKEKEFLGIDSYDRALEERIDDSGNMEKAFGDDLVEIDSDRQTAVFDYHDFEKTEWNEKREAFDVVPVIKKAMMKYDFIHITPPMKSVHAVANSPLAWQTGERKGWLAVDPSILRHVEYPNVFGIGDVLGIPGGKSAGSIYREGPVLEKNLVAAMEGKEPVTEFDGYTSCPLHIKCGETMPNSIITVWRLRYLSIPYKPDGYGGFRIFICSKRSTSISFCGESCRPETKRGLEFEGRWKIVGNHETSFARSVLLH